MDKKAKLTEAQQRVMGALKRGCRVWRYSTEGYGWIIDGDPRRVRRQCLEALIDKGLIEVDQEATFYRESSGSDEVYKLTETAKG